MPPSRSSTELRMRVTGLKTWLKPPQEPLVRGGHYWRGHEFRAPHARQAKLSPFVGRAKTASGPGFLLVGPVGIEPTTSSVSGNFWPFLHLSAPHADVQKPPLTWAFTVGGFLRLPTSHAASAPQPRPKRAPDSTRGQPSRAAPPATGETPILYRYCSRRVGRMELAPCGSRVMFRIRCRCRLRRSRGGRIRSR